MRRRTIWIGFAASVVAASVALASLSFVATRAESDRDRAYESARTAERSEARAKRMIERRDRIGRAVWRLDTMLTPLVAQESTRPAAAFRSFLDSGPEAEDPGQQVRTNSVSRGGTLVPGDEALPSPLLTWVSDYVVLHFQVDERGVWSSPQAPEPDEPWQRWITDSALAERREQLTMLSSSIAPRELLRRLPDRWLQMQSGDLYVNNSLDYPTVVPEIDRSDASAYRQDSLRQMASQKIPYEPSSIESVGSSPSTTEKLEVEQEDHDAAVFDAGVVASEGAETGAIEPGAIETSDVGFRDWDLRNRLFESFANESLRNQRLVLNYEQSAEGNVTTGEGLTRPIWIDGKLLLARRWRTAEQAELIQGCWLDWPRLRERLLADIGDLLPEADLQPIDEGTSLEPAMLLATLPVQLVVPEIDANVVDGGDTLLRKGAVPWVLIAAWSALGLAASAAAVVIFQAESLAARRAQFVSSVTHELRTPLTTFRMYTEMLESGMVPSGTKTREYLSTLRSEAERLTHLVDNVLVYSRLEHGGKRRALIPSSVGSLLERIEPRLQERAQAARMSWTWSASLRGATESSETPSTSAALESRVAVDPIAFEQVLFNLVDNACKYANQGEAPAIELRIEIEPTRWTCTVVDRGPGIPPERRHRLFRLFAKSDSEAAMTAPGVGLGLALSRRLASEMGGRLEFVPSDGIGSRFRLSLPR